MPEVLFQFILYLILLILFVGCTHDTKPYTPPSPPIDIEKERRKEIYKLKDDLLKSEEEYNKSQNNSQRKELLKKIAVDLESLGDELKDDTDRKRGQVHSWLI